MMGSQAPSGITGDDAREEIRQAPNAFVLSDSVSLSCEKGVRRRKAEVARSIKWPDGRPPAVIAAKAVIQCNRHCARSPWFPAFAGMTPISASASAAFTR